MLRTTRWNIMQRVTASQNIAPINVQYSRIEMRHQILWYNDWYAKLLEITT